MSAAVAEYDAHRGYRHIDARRYERRRYGSPIRRMNLWLLRRTLARALTPVAGGLVLDAPCGTGILDGFLAARGFRVVGADISPAMLAVARERGGAIGHVRADLETPPWRRRSFAAVVSVRFLMHLPAAHRPHMLEGLAALTHGPVVATVCHPYTVKSLLRRLRRAIGLKAKTSERVTRAQLRDEVSRAGLRLDRILPVLPLLSEVWVVVLRAAPIP